MPCQLHNLAEDPRTCPQNCVASGKPLSYSNAPLRQFRSVSFTLSREARELEQPCKRHRLDLLSIEGENDSLGDNQINNLPSDFPFSIYQFPSPPSPKR